MESDKEPGIVAIDTLVLCRELHGGAWTVQPLAEPDRVSYGDLDEALTRLERFLEQHLLLAPTRVVARYGLPSGVKLVDVDVAIERLDLPKRLARELTVRFPCVLVPAGTAFWVMIPVLDHTFFVAGGEDLPDAVASEVCRLVAARGAWTYDALELLPAAHERLVPMQVLLSHEGQGLLGRARGIRKRRVKEHQRAQALAVLTRVATPLHAPAAKLGGRPAVHVGREALLAQLDALLAQTTRGSVLLVGEEGVGKSALVRAHCERQKQHGRDFLVFATSSAQLVAGMSGFGEWQERVGEVVRAAETLDAVLYFENLKELFGERPERGGVDVAGVLRPYVVDGRLRLLGEIEPDALDGVGRRQPALISAMSQLAVPPLTESETRSVLVAHLARWQKEDGPRVDDGVVGPVVELTSRYLPYRSFPGKAVRFVEELRVAAQASETIGVDRVYEAFSVFSGIPLFLLRPDHGLRTEQMVAQLRRRVVGQHEAVRRVADTLSVVKARLQPEGKPLSTFLFIGPTGVGKTEVARALAELLFGSDDRMARFDMSEYGDPYAAERLIRGTERDGGVLTSRVREQPFSLLLLDEIEKAHPAVFDLLLSVLGEGRLTDARGRTTFFHNTIIILTSNLGAGDDRQPLGLRSSAERADQRYLRAVHAAFRPELVGRLDRIVVFEPLSPAQIEEVTDLAIARLADRRGLTEHGVALRVSKSARGIVARGGYDPRYGVRALRRHLDASVVVPVARLLTRWGAEARGALVWVGSADEGSCPEMNRKQRLARTSVGELVVELYRRAAAGGRRALAGIEAVADVRRRIDALMDRDEARAVVDHLALCRAQLANARGRDPQRHGRHGLRGEDIDVLAREQHRIESAIGRVDALRDDVRAAEQLCLTALFEGESVDEWAGEAAGLLGQLHGAVAGLLLCTRALRDEVTVALFLPDGPAPVLVWLEPLIAEASKRGWQLVFHERRDGPHGGSWPSVRPFGPGRDAAWARGAIASGHSVVVMRARGKDVGLWLTLEAGMHRIIGVGRDDAARCFEVRLAATRFDLSDDDWLRPELTRMPASPRRGVVVARERHRRGLDVMVNKERVAAVEHTDYWSRIEEIALEHLLFHHDHGTVEALWRGVCDVPIPDDDEEDP